ncbi:hypothetical protein [Desulfobacter postgatei]|uniref:Uncharacterized protein n=1 Tax=Desulfobacter postgatei 2ac9 TaxID=879212 RepID=I5B7K8_9BACT|nr:hypothetical protein [Desulfobacter postgatei]EIM65471.1 hypothetical protein DespoDRAFT_03736 [Desulfobacter postgatei 2ac9]
MAIIISLISLGIAALSLIITVTKNIRDKQFSDDKELFEQLKQSLKLAYDSLVMENGRPINNKHKWLKAARHIARYRKLRDELHTKVFKIICEEQEEYWRDKFYSLLGKIENHDFYKSIDTGRKIKEEKIEPRSAAIVHSFAVWKKDRPDPIDDMSFEEIVSNYNLFSPLHRPFREYIKSEYPGMDKKTKEFMTDCSTE